MKKYFLVILVVVLITFRLSAQINFQEMAKVVDVLPPSPKAGSLGTYGNLPVGITTGTPQINVPIYTLKTQNLSIPISLDYSSNGVRVDELAGNVGTGWVLNAGGVISRTVYGNNDEATTWLATPPYLATGTSQSIFNFLTTASELSTTGGGTSDNQPDIFSYNFNGYSGKFLYDTTRNIIHIAHSNLKIEAIVLGYKITTPDGVAYFFGGVGGREQSRTHSSGTCSHEYANYVPTAYYLKKIIHPKGDSIIFNYNINTYSYFSGISQSFTISNNNGRTVTGCGEMGEAILCPPTNDLSTCPSRLTIESLTLREIVTSQNDKVVFKNILRTDIADSLVNRIEIYHRKNLTAPFLTYYLNYAYSNSGTSYTNTYTLPELKLRPFLLNVSEKNATDSNRYYAFEYNDYNGLPPRLSYAQDDRGYFNGKSNAYLVPKSTNYEFRQIFNYTLADRSASATHGAKGILKKVYYPTKGYDSLIYEGHTYRGTVYVPNAATPISISIVGIGSHSAASAQTSNWTLPVYQNINFTFSCLAVPGKSPNASDNYGVVTVYKNGGYLFSETIALNQTVNISRELNTGTYKVEVKAYGESVSCSASFSYSAGGSNVTSNINTGGVRISSIKSYDYSGHSVGVKRYYYAELLSDLNISTGVMVDPIGDYYQEITNLRDCHVEDPVPYTYSKCYFVNAYAGASRNVAGGGGSHVYYATVLESFGENFENGGVEHKFMTESNYAVENLRGLRIQGTVLSNIGFNNGLKTEENAFSKSGTNKIYKSKKTFGYTIDTRIYKEINGYIVRKRFNNPMSTTPPAAFEFEGFDVAQYWINIRWVPLTSTTTTVYDADGNNPVSTTVSNAYDNVTHAQPTRVTSVNSEGETQVIITTYPSDYANGTAFIDNMKTNHLIGLPIEQVKYKEEGAAKKILAGSITQYQAGGKGVKASEMLFETAAPVDLTAFKFSNRSTGVLLPAGTATSFSADSKYKTRLTYSAYDAINNIQQYAFSDNIPNTLIWDYKNQYPVAQVKNAVFSNVAYTSFEEDGKGNWTFSGSPVTYLTVSGQKAYNLSNGNITKTIVSGTVYTISYWRPSSLSALTIAGTQSGYPIAGHTINGWKYFEHKITGQTTATVSGTGVIDELRLYPVVAEMSTMVYEPSIGLTSQFDAASRVSYYEYDGFGRLTFIKDQDKNILKQICYNYAGQPEACTVYESQDKSGNYTRSCSTGYTGSSVYVSIPAGAFTSTVSLTDANNQAMAYGQQQANLLGTCTSNNIDFRYTNSVANPFGITLTNVATSQTYTFGLPPMQTSPTVAGQIPAGYYNVSISPAGGSGGVSRNYQIGSYFTSSSANTVTASNIFFSCGTCTSLQIY